MLSIQNGQKKDVKPQLTTPSSDIIGEGAAVFTDMTETILDVLDKLVNTSSSSQQSDKKYSLRMIKKRKFIERN